MFLVSRNIIKHTIPLFDIILWMFSSIYNKAHCKSRSDFLNLLFLSVLRGFLNCIDVPLCCDQICPWPRWGEINRPVVFLWRGLGVQIRPLWWSSSIFFESLSWTSVKISTLLFSKMNKNTCIWFGFSTLLYTSALCWRPSFNMDTS